MADLERMAHAAVNIHPSRIRSISRVDKWETAWHEIVVLLYASPEPPSWGECVGAAGRAIARERDEWEHHHGWSRKSGEPTPAFRKFWATVTEDRDDFTAAVVEGLALPQVLATLTNKQYEAVVTLSVHRTQQEAALAIGVSPHTFGRHLRAAREKFLTLWLEGETPRSGVSREPVGEQCRHGHSRTEHGYKTSEGVWACRICRRNDQRRFQARGRGDRVSRSKQAAS